MSRTKSSNVVKAKVNATVDAAEKVTEIVEKNAVTAVKKVQKTAGQIASNENVIKAVDKIKDTTAAVKTKATRAKKAVEKKAAVIVEKEVKPSLFIQYLGKEVSEQIILEKFYEEWLKEHKLSEIKSLTLYFKIEESTAYCVVNETTQIVLKDF